MRIREFAESQRAVENRAKWRKLAAKSSVVPQPDPRGKGIDDNDNDDDENQGLLKVFSEKKINNNPISQTVASSTLPTARNTVFLMSAFPVHLTSFCSGYFQIKLRVS